MKRVALLFSCAEYGEALAKAVENIGEYQVDVISHIPVADRVKMVCRNDYDLLVADEPIGNGPFAIGLGRLTDTPCATVFRGWSDLMKSHNDWGWLHEQSIMTRTRFTIKQTDCLFVLGDVTREKLGQFYDVERSLTVGRPLDVSKCRSGTETAQGADFAILTVTNLRYEGKFEGVTTIIDALKPLFEKHDQLQYRIAGNGPYLPNLREYVDDIGFNDRIDILGWHSDVPDLLANADVFAYVSYDDAYPTAVHEAQAAGLPVVGGDAVGVPDTVGKAGLVCQASPTGVRDAIQQLFNDDVYRAELARQSTKRMDGYNAVSARRYIAIWDALIDGRDPQDERLPSISTTERVNSERQVVASGSQIP